MKKILLTTLAVVLLFSCLFFNPSFDGVVKAGAGNGTNEKIESAEDLAAILTYLNYSNQKTRGVEKVEKPFDSATITQKTNFSSSTSNSSGEIRATSQKLNRVLVIYATENSRERLLNWLREVL